MDAFIQEKGKQANSEVKINGMLCPPTEHTDRATQMRGLFRG
jgi:hypothetical protein